MGAEVIGKKSSVLAYFGLLLAILSVILLVIFAVQLTTSPSTIGSGLFTKGMLFFQLSIIGVLAPSVAFCSYLSLRLKLRSRLYLYALRASGFVLLAIFPVGSLLAVYVLWLANRTKSIG